jgi:hypothetical protein
MAAANVASIMSGLNTRLDTIQGLRCYPYPSDSISVPAAIVAFPEVIEYDSTMARGSDRLVVPVHVLVGKVSDRTARTRLGAYLNGSGSSSVKSAIETDVTLGATVQTVRVTEAEINVMTVGAADYLAATFTVEVIS